MDGIGFGLENYDAQGRYREHDEGRPECRIAGVGEVTGIGSFSGPAELSERLLESDGFRASMVAHLFQFAMAGEPDSQAKAWIDELAAELRDTDALVDLLVDFVADERFRWRRTL